MKMSRALQLCLGAILAALYVGCATAQIDWNTRVGVYTYDQAIHELGPPDKQAKLSDGQNVAEWVTHHYNGSSFAVGTGFYGRPGGVGVIQSVGQNGYDTSLRLTFTTNNILANWSKK